jgi:hypothetical protein
MDAGITSGVTQIALPLLVHDRCTNSGSRHRHRHMVSSGIHSHNSAAKLLG